MSCLVDKNILSNEYNDVTVIQVSNDFSSNFAKMVI